MHYLYDLSFPFLYYDPWIINKEAFFAQKKRTEKTFFCHLLLLCVAFRNFPRKKKSQLSHNQILNFDSGLVSLSNLGFRRSENVGAEGDRELGNSFGLLETLRPWVPLLLHASCRSQTWPSSFWFMVVLTSWSMPWLLFSIWLTKCRELGFELTSLESSIFLTHP